MANDNSKTDTIQVVSIEELAWRPVDEEEHVAFHIDSSSHNDDWSLETATVLYNFSTAFDLYERHHQAYQLLQLAYRMLQQQGRRDACTLGFDASNLEQLDSIVHQTAVPRRPRFLFFKT